MNSVFSAFKSSKSDGSLPSNQAKSLGATDTSSYASLRHIREIGATATMSSFVELSTDDDSIAPNLRLANKMPSMDAGRSIELPASATEYDASLDESAAARPRPDIDRCGRTNGDRSPEPNALADATSSPINAHIPPDGLDHSTPNHATHDIMKHTNHLSNGHWSAIENKENAEKPVPSTNSSELIGYPCATLATSADHLTNGHCEAAAAVAAVVHDTNGKHTPVLSAASNRKSMKSVDPSTATTSPNKAATQRLSKRLSLSGIGNSPLPSVHGRSTYGSHSVGASSGTNGETMRTRKTTHQRNLSLDFRWILPFLLPIFVHTFFHLSFRV